jgi:hypothetical protein
MGEHLEACEVEVRSIVELMDRISRLANILVARTAILEAAVLFMVAWCRVPVPANRVEALAEVGVVEAAKAIAAAVEVILVAGVVVVAAAVVIPVVAAAAVTANVESRSVFGF